MTHWNQCSGYVSQRYGSGSGSSHHQANRVTKPLIFTFLWLLYAFLSVKNDVNVYWKSNEQSNNFLLAFEGHWCKTQDPEPEPYPDPLVRDVDLRIRIGTKMSWIRHTDSEPYKLLVSFFATKFTHRKIDDTDLCLVTISRESHGSTIAGGLIISDNSLVSGIACPGAPPCASWSLFHTFQVNLARRPARCLR